MNAESEVTKHHKSLFPLLLGPGLGLFTWMVFPGDGEYPLAARTAGVAVWMGAWWLTEAVPLAVTSLLPLVFFPLMGVMKANAVAGLYTNDVVFLFLGGFLVALAMEKWELHRRIALHVLLAVGGGLRRTLLGFMVATALLSMWISNTATAMMMVPIAAAVLTHYDRLIESEVMKKISVGLLLGVAYSASIGGIATLVGTPPNLAFARIFEMQFPVGPQVSFAEWIVFALPLSLMMLALSWMLLSLLYMPKLKSTGGTRALFRKELDGLGRTSFEEKVVMTVFSVLALLWITRRPLSLGLFTIPGWSDLLPEPGYIGDGTVAVALATILFVIPSRRKGERILDWSTARRLPWRIVLLFGGGFALAGAITAGGLSAWIGSRMEGLSSLPPLAMTASLCALMTFLTELTSNTATTQMALPILAATAVAIGRNPFFLMVPATLSASCAFMMPVATPPNAIIFGTGRVTIAQMARTGILLNLLGVLLITLWLHVAGPARFGGGPSTLPEWAVETEEVEQGVLPKNRI